MTSNVVLEIDRGANGTSRVAEPELDALADGHVRLRIDRFAVTANNVTYAAFGDMLGYWDFYPSGADGWGRVPAVGWASVVESNVVGIEVGERYSGWFPMAQFVDLHATPSTDGLRDDGEHRSAHAPIYRTFPEAGRDPMLAGVDLSGDITDLEDRHSLLRVLFLTGFLLDQQVGSLPGGAPEQVLVLSASSKTGIGLAHQAAMRDGMRVVGVTSERNAGFVGSLGCYDQVVTYDDLGSIADVSSAVVDMAGAGEVVAAIHERLGDHVVSSLIVGRSHHDAPMAEVRGGAAPEFFFAPTVVEERVAEWGTEGYRSRVSDALAVFVDDSRSWLTIDRRSGADGAVETWNDVFGGGVPPSVGRIVSIGSS